MPQPGFFDLDERYAKLNIIRYVSRSLRRLTTSLLS